MGHKLVSDGAIEEARNFALASRQFVTQPRALAGAKRTTLRKQTGQ